MKISAPFRLSVSTIAFLGGLAGATVAQAALSDSRSEEPAPDDSAAEGGAIVVTGVRGARPRTVADSPVPIDVIDAKELQATGRAGLKDILGNIVPSLTVPALGGGGTSSGAKPISIRGLSGDYVLVLVNGKRRHTTSLINNLSRISGGSTPVDIDLLPANAIGRVEVLRDGAAAQYGSDAISGVINFILDSAPEGGEFSTTAGSLYEKGGELVQQSVSYGTRLGVDGGFIRFAVEGKYHDRADTSGATVASSVDLYPRLEDGSRDPREATIDRNRAGNYGRTNRDYILNTSYNAELPVGEDTTLYSFSTLSYRDIKDGRGQFNANNVNSLPELYPNGFLAKRRIWETDFQVTRRCSSFSALPVVRPATLPCRIMRKRFSRRSRNAVSCSWRSARNRPRCCAISSCATICPLPSRATSTTGSRSFWASTSSPMSVLRRRLPDGSAK